MSDDFRWYGYINQLTYAALDLETYLDDRKLNRIADMIIEQRIFSVPIETYYRAITLGLQSGKPLRFLDEHDEDAVRDYLIRLRDALDERRPWPEHPFETLEAHEDWHSMQTAPAIARIDASSRQVTRFLHRNFEYIAASDGKDLEVLLLKLQTSQVVALVAETENGSPVYLHSHEDPVITREFFKILTEIPLQPLGDD